MTENARRYVNSEIVDEFNKNNYNFVVESINKIIKNVISQL